MDTRSNDLKKARVLSMLLEIDDYEMHEILPLITKFFGPMPLSNPDVMRGEVKGTLTLVGYKLLNQDLGYRKLLYEGQHLMTRQSFTRVNMRRINLEKLITCEMSDLDKLKILIEENLHFNFVPDDTPLDVNVVITWIDLLIENQYTASAETPLKRIIYTALHRIGYQEVLSDEEYDALTFKFYHIAKGLAIRLKNEHPKRCNMISSYRKL